MGNQISPNGCSLSCANWSPHCNGHTSYQLQAVPLSCMTCSEMEAITQGVSGITKYSSAEKVVCRAALSHHMHHFHFLRHPPIAMGVLMDW